MSGGLEFESVTKMEFIDALKAAQSRMEALEKVAEAAKSYKKFRDENPHHVGTSAREDLFALLAALDKEAA